MKASEVFDLPVASGGRIHDSDDIFQADGNGVWCATFCSDEQAKVAANCINHADALADSLEDLMEWHVKNVHIVHHPTFDRAHKALAAYRGAK